MKAEIITIGDEILIGQVVDSNSTFIGKQLTKIGIDVLQIKTIRDEKSEILQALKSAAHRTNLIIITGGLGPTKDDITKSTFCTYFEDELVVHQKTEAYITNMLQKIEEPLLQVNLDQAKVPSTAKVLPNRFGTAPGMWFEKDEVVYVSLPGVPYEMKAILKDEVIPRLTEEYNRPVILQKTALTYGMGESRVAKRIEDWQDNLPQNMSLAYLPNPGRVRLRLTIKANDEETAQQELNYQLKKLENLIGDIIGGYEEEETSLQESVAKTLTEKRKTIGLAESFTGGKIANLFTEIPGASKYFKGGLIPYETKMKEKILGVKAETLEKYSVVSAEVAEEMAIQTQKIFDADYAVSTTGNAGPTRGDSNAEVGTVFIGIATPATVNTYAYNFGNSRERTTGKAIHKALELLLKELRRV